MKREALILDDFSDATLNLVEVLIGNGFTVHLLTNSERARMFLLEPTYIHLFDDLSSLADALSDINLDNVEVALLLSPNDELNLMLAKMLRERGVPRVVVTLRGSRGVEEARELGVDVIDVSHHIMNRVQRFLQLRYSKITPISGDIGMLEMLITGDSRILGATVMDLERRYEADIIVIREGRLVRDPDTVLQVGDYLIAVGSMSSLSELLRNA
ncbi:MAG: TrkA C-terminal domain-containing protein [Desulfurococcales archaeon]|nr:NAD-binding protein [Desulfurococcaceae archaeon]MCC6060872.1 NAD-binding protein [Desulfurococcaceae archaeon]MDT7866380.1 TrkA C-terminal domain-containing protein [Desulfurococcales archaeon]